MINQKSITYNGLTVHVREAKADTTHDVVLTVMVDKYSTSSKKLVNEFRDLELEAQGYERFAVVNGGLFFTQDGVTYAEGIEQVGNVVHENDDTNLDTCMAFYIVGGVPYIVPQSYAKSKLSISRGALTGAFGLINNGVMDTRGCLQRSAIYNAKSGRSIVGKKADGTIVLAYFYGVTGQSGLTGYETVQLAKHLGLTNAVCMDGGGSVVSNARPVKNGIGLYSKSNIQVGQTVSIGGSYKVTSVGNGKAFLGDLGVSIDITKLKVE